jgi:hypothetical protein
MSVGIYFGFCGLLLVAIFTVRVHLNISTLPLSLEAVVSTETGNLSNEYRWLVFIWVGPLFLVASFTSVLAAAPYLLGLNRYFPMRGTIFSGAVQMLEIVLALGVSLAILGRPAAKIVRSCIQLPEPRYALLGFLLPIGIGILCVVAPYFADRVQLAGLNLPNRTSNLF